MKSVIRNLRTKSFVERMVFYGIWLWKTTADFSHNSNAPWDLYGKNLPCTGCRKELDKVLWSVCVGAQRSWDMHKYWDKKQLKITQQNEPEIRSVKKKRHRIRDWPDSVSAEKQRYRAA